MASIMIELFCTAQLQLFVSLSIIHDFEATEVNASIQVHAKIWSFQLE